MNRLNTCRKIQLSLSDPIALITGKGVIAVKESRKRAMKKRAKKIMKRIVESVIGRFIYDVLKKLFEDND